MSGTGVLPQVIQGGMGIGISGWRLARAVSAAGQLGVVSGTALDTLFVRRLQDGDPDGGLRRAMRGFPLPEVCEEVLRKFFRSEGRPEGRPYLGLSKFRLGADRFRQQIAVLSSYVEVRLAKERHDGEVGINLLTKVQLPNLAFLYGAMLAGVDVVLMGAGIPREIPRALDQLAQGRPAAIRLDVEADRSGVSEQVRLDPREVAGEEAPPARRPRFVPIVSSSSLAALLLKKSQGSVSGFVIEGSTAGGHNAPPRGAERRNPRGEPVYGDRDQVDLAPLRDLGVPFWLAGGAGTPSGLDAACAGGAAGIQVGTLFALCRESGLAPELRRRSLAAAAGGAFDVFTDPAASPTGFPFKILALEGTLSESERFAARRRICDLGYLAMPYRRPDGALGYRCAAEPLARFIAKGGDPEATRGRMCLCNGLFATAGHPQIRRDGRPELPIVTSGTEVAALADLSPDGADYSAVDVIAYLLAGRGSSKTPVAS